MKKLFILFLSIGLFTACSDDDTSTDDDITSANIILNDTNGDPVSGTVVYAYNESTWSVIGDQTNFADFQAATGADGVATFSNLTTNINFSNLNNFTHTFRFSVRYSINGEDKIKVRPITFDLGDDLTDTIILD